MVSDNWFLVPPIDSKIPILGSGDVNGVRLLAKKFVRGPLNRALQDPDGISVLIFKGSLNREVLGKLEACGKHSSAVFILVIELKLGGKLLEVVFVSFWSLVSFVDVAPAAAASFLDSSCFLFSSSSFF